MQKQITGIHHITALASDSQQNLDFYAGVLGLRFIKKTVNFDAPEIYHLYYGDEAGLPGTILTFFPYEGIRPGRFGAGMLNTTTFSVPSTAIAFWEKRLQRFNIDYEKPTERFAGELVLYFKDSDGLGLELIFNDADHRPGYSSGYVPPEFSIKGLYSAEIWEDDYQQTVDLLTGEMEHVLIAEQGSRLRFAATDAPGSYIDIVHTPKSLRGFGGGGTVHHIAFSTPDNESQLALRRKIAAGMLNPTPVIDRQYFKSVYFHEPGGVLFEIATAGPGFAVDEEPQHLGQELKLPPQYESIRSELQKRLKPLSLKTEKYG